MRLRHPYSLEDGPPDPDGAVHWGSRGDVAEVDDDGTFEVPDSRAPGFVGSWPTAEGYTLEELRVEETETCQEVKGDGEVCGRELPCPYHSQDTTEDE